MGIISTNQFSYRGIPQDLVLCLRDKFKITDFIETGTYMGDTAIWAADHFKRVVTFEASNEIYQILTKKSLQQNLISIFGDSSKLIGAYINNDTIFYLDAHYSSGNTFNSYPLLDEINEINKNENNAFIIIDDARFILSKWNNERYCTLYDIMNILSVKKRYTVIFDDMIISVPMYAKDLLDDYTNENSKVYWENFLNGPPRTKLEILKKVVPRSVKKILKKLFNV